MSIENWYWLFLVLWVVLYGVGYWSEPESPRGRIGRVGSLLMQLILFVLIGWKIMGDLVKG